jgi:hypothetical protein
MNKISKIGLFGIAIVRNFMIEPEKFYTPYNTASITNYNFLFFNLVYLTTYEKPSMHSASYTISNSYFFLRRVKIE